MISMIFDVDDTLYDQVIPFRAACGQAYGTKAAMMAEQIYKAFHVRANEVFEAGQRGDISMTDMRVYRISKAMEDCGLTSSRQEALDFQESYAQNQKNIYLPDTIKECLDLCKEAGVSMGLLTNGPSAHQRRKIETLKLNNWIPEQNIFISQEVGCSKPEPEIFRAVERAMNLERESTYMVGDSYINDIGGAMQAGWKSIWMNRRSLTSEDEVKRPDYIIKDDLELKNLLRQILS